MSIGMYVLAFFGIAALAVRGQSPLYGQCGGIGWTGATTCVSGGTCAVVNDYYYQCLPGTGPSPTSAPPSTTTAPTAPAGTCALNSPPSTAGKLRFTGVNIAGFDFGCNSDGVRTICVQW